jgi:hypothetical protein
VQQLFVLESGRGWHRSPLVSSLNSSLKNGHCLDDFFGERSSVRSSASMPDLQPIAHVLFPVVAGLNRQLLVAQRGQPHRLKRCRASANVSGGSVAMISSASCANACAASRRACRPVRRFFP